MPEWTPRLEANVLLDFEGDLCDIAAYEAYGGYAQLRRAIEGMDADGLIAELGGAALRGRGGAGFPTGRKASFLAAGAERYLVVNADESEPGSCKDRELLLRTPHALLEGILVVMNVLRLTRAYIYIRGEYLTESEVLEEAIAEARARGYVGAPSGSDGYVPEITVHRGAGAYICGEETALLASLNGFRGQPTSKPPFPAVSGAFERPTLLNNVETIATIPAIMRRGAEEYKALGTEQSGGTHVMSVSGHVLRPGNYEMGMSETMGHLIVDLAGGVPAGRSLKAVIPGGASSPILGPEALDLLCAPEALAAAGTMAGSAGVMVIDDSTCIVQLALRTAEFYTHESCGKCTPCREGTRWITETLRRIEDGIAAHAEIDLVLDICDNVEGKCLCPLGDACAMPVRSMVKRFRAEFEAHVDQGSCPLHDSSSLSSLYPQPRSLLPLVTATPA
jgi:NADH-quinone oxidoreductase subunit F